MKVELKKRAGNFTFHFNTSIHVHFLLAFHRFVGDFDRMIKRWWRVVKEISLTFIYDAFIIAFGNFPNSCACSIRNHTFSCFYYFFVFECGLKVQHSFSFSAFQWSLVFALLHVSEDFGFISTDFFLFRSENSANLCTTCRVGFVIKDKNS